MKPPSSAHGLPVQFVIHFFPEDRSFSVLTLFHTPTVTPGSWYCGVPLHAANKYLCGVRLRPVTILSAGMEIMQSVLMEPTGRKEANEGL